MDNHVIIRRIRVTGEKKCDYHLEEGLNIFAGSNSTGKTTLLLLIDYIFGSTTGKFISEVENFTNFVYVDIIINSREYTIKRGIREDKENLVFIPQNGFDKIQPKEISYWAQVPISFRIPQQTGHSVCSLHTADQAYNALWLS